MSLRFALHVRVCRAVAIGLACTLAALASGSDAHGCGCSCGSVADEFQAADAGLVREWIVQAPFDSSLWRVAHVVEGDDLVLVQSGDGGVHAIRTSGSTGDRTGTVAWSYTASTATGRSWPATIGSRLVVVTGDRAVHALDPDTGAVRWERPTGALTAGPAVQAGAWVYVPLETGRIWRLPADPFDHPRSTEPPTVADDTEDRGRKTAATPTPRESLEPVSIDAGGHAVTAPVPLGNGVIWGTDRGLVALEPATLRWLRHEFPETNTPTSARKAFLGPPVVDRDRIFVVTADGVLARLVLNAPRHRGLWAAWIAPLPDRPVSGPLVADDTVLVSLGPSGIVAFAAADGRERWRADVVGTVLAVAGGRAWVLDETGRLVALDLASGIRRRSWCLGCFTLPVVQVGSGRIVLASPSGLVVSLAPPARPATQPPVTAAGSPASPPEPADPGATLP